MNAVVMLALIAAAPPVDKIRPSAARYALPEAGEIEVADGGRRSEEIRRGLDPTAAALEQCSTGLAATDTGVAVVLAIDAKGSVERATIEGVRAPDRRGQCVLAALASAAFDASTAEHQTVRFRLAPEPLPESGVAVVGVVPAAQILDVAEQHADAVRACYSGSNAARDSITGTVALRYAIDARGNVSGASVDHMDAGLDDVATCLVREVDAWTLPRANGRTLVIEPFTF